MEWRMKMKMINQFLSKMPIVQEDITSNDDCVKTFHMGCLINPKLKDMEESLLEMSLLNAIIAAFLEFTKVSPSDFMKGKMNVKMLWRARPEIEIKDDINLTITARFGFKEFVGKILGVQQ